MTRKFPCKSAYMAYKWVAEMSTIPIMLGANPNPH